MTILVRSWYQTPSGRQVTDYPDRLMVENIAWNLARNLDPEAPSGRRSRPSPPACPRSPFFFFHGEVVKSRTAVEGFKWGEDRMGFGPGFWLGLGRWSGLGLGKEELNPNSNPKFLSPHLTLTLSVCP